MWNYICSVVVSNFYNHFYTFFNMYIDNIFIHVITEKSMWLTNHELGVVCQTEQSVLHK